MTGRVATITDLYAEPDIYDILHAPGTAEEVAAILNLARQLGLRPQTDLTTFLEPACGTARHLRLLHARGYPVLGFDAEPAMIAYANAALRGPAVPAGSPSASSASSATPRGTGVSPVSTSSAPSPHLFTARFDTFHREHSLPPIHFAFNLINSIRHVRSDAELVRHLKAVRSVLAPNGLYIVGLSTTAYGLEPPTEDTWTGSRRSTTVRQSIHYIPPHAKPGRPPPAAQRFEQVFSHITVTRAKHPPQELASTYRLRTYSLDEWQAAIRRAGLTVALTTDQDARPIAPPRIGYALYALLPFPEGRGRGKGSPRATGNGSAFPVPSRSLPNKARK